MRNKHETLAEFTSRVMAEKGLSFRRVAERSGAQISHSTVAEIANGQRFDIRKDTLIALAKGLNVPADDVFRVARGLAIDTAGRFEIYAERFDAHEIEQTEWEFLESYFNDHVQRFKEFKRERERMIADLIKADDSPPAKLAPVVARIEPGRKTEREVTRDDVRRMITGDEIDEIKRRVTPRKKKAG